MVVETRGEDLSRQVRQDPDERRRRERTTRGEATTLTMSNTINKDMYSKVIDSHNMTKTDTFTSSKSGTKTVAISMTVPKIDKGI